MKNIIKTLTVSLTIFFLFSNKNSYAQIRKVFNNLSSINKKQVDKLPTHQTNKVLNQANDLKRVKSVKNRTINLQPSTKNSLNSHSSFQQKSFRESNQTPRVNNTKSTRPPNTQRQHQFDRTLREQQLEKRKVLEKKLNQSKDKSSDKIITRDDNNNNGRNSNKLKPIKEANGDHTVFKRGNNKTVYKYETYEKVKGSNFNPQKRYDGGKPDGTNGRAHTNKITKEKIKTPHVQGKSVKGGVREAKNKEIPKGNG